MCAVKKEVSRFQCVKHRKGAKYFKDDAIFVRVLYFTPVVGVILDVGWRKCRRIYSTVN